MPVHLTSRHPRRSLTDCLLWQSWTPSDKKRCLSTEHYFTTTPKFQTGCIGTLQGQVNTTTALVYESDYYAFCYLSSHILLLPSRASYSFHLSSPHRHNINQEDPYLLALCLDDTIPWPNTSCTSPSFTAALYISVISVDSMRSLNLRALRICHLDEVEEIDE